MVDLPINAVGDFVTAPTTGFLAAPGGSLGNLCLGAPGRYLTQVMTAGAGSVSFSLTSPQSPSRAAVRWPSSRVTGSSDTATPAAELPASNFSSSIGITFQQARPSVPLAAAALLVSREGVAASSVPGLLLETELVGRRLGAQGNAG